MAEVELVLSYEGAQAKSHELDFYDAAIALLGFQRSLAITTHFVLNGAVITQAPALRGARLLVQAPEAGSFRVKTAVKTDDGTAAGNVTGELISATYDHVVGRTLGFPADDIAEIAGLMERRRGVAQAPSGASIERLDAVVEKCEAAIRDMHRPIVMSETAEKAKISASTKKPRFLYALSRETYENIQSRSLVQAPEEYIGRVSAYNLNTFKGRVYISENRRPVPFEVSDSARTPGTTAAIVRSFAENAGSRFSDAGALRFRAYPSETATGRLKSLLIVGADY